MPAVARLQVVLSFNLQKTFSPCGREGLKISLRVTQLNVRYQSDSGIITLLNLPLRVHLMNTLTISAFFSGTDHKIDAASDDIWWLPTLFHENVDHTDDNPKTENPQKKIGYNGCAINYGFPGAIFGTGIDKDAKEVIEKIKAEIAKGHKVVFNAYGHSRGAITALLIAKQLGNVNPKYLEINLFLHDPVPGNLLTTAALDPFNISLANKTMDLRSCKALQNVITLYPHEALNPLMAHAPLFPRYPRHTNVEEEVIADCHAGAQYYTKIDERIHFTPASFMAFARAFKFLKACGTQFRELPKIHISGIECDEECDPNDQESIEQFLIKVYEEENKKIHRKTTRAAHSATGLSIHVKSNPNIKYYNLHHQRLAATSLSIHVKSNPNIKYYNLDHQHYNLDHQRLNGSEEDKTNVRVTIEKTYGPISLIKMAITNYPNAWQALKWTVLSLAISALIVSTGGFGALPIAAGASASLIILAIVAFAPLAGGAAAALWYSIAKPLIELTVNAIYYPNYRQEWQIQFATNPDEPGESTRDALELLGRRGRKETEEKNSELEERTYSNLFVSDDEEERVLPTKEEAFNFPY